MILSRSSPHRLPLLLSFRRPMSVSGGQTEDNPPLVDSIEKAERRILLFDGKNLGRQHMMVSSLAVMQMVFWGVNNGMSMAIPLPVDPRAVEAQSAILGFMSDPMWMTVGTGLSMFFFFYAKVAIHC